MTYSVVDISGLNRISERILSNAAGAIAGMAKVKVRGLARVRFMFTFAMVAYNLIRMPRLLSTAA